MKIKSLLFAILTIGLFHLAVAQDYSNLEKLQLNSKADYEKAEGQALECSNYLLNSPVKMVLKDLNHLYALQFLMKWMGGTPDYTFDIDKTITEITKSKSDLLGIYMAAMTKYVLENKDSSHDADAIKYNAFMTFITYCENENNNVKQNKQLKELIKAKDENRLKAYLNIN